MSGLKQKLGKIAIGLSVTSALYLGLVIWNYVSKINSAHLVEKAYLSLQEQAELISEDLGFIQTERENYVLEFTEMNVHGVRPNHKQIMERAEMNMHGQTPTIEQRSYIADYALINECLRSRELELKIKEAQLLDNINNLEPSYFEALRTLRKY
ncbi:hypothetical protein HYZ97_01580 [Candidatus Pacearchaeota archaeon]|nr:hypothetical protein [Candidatus Pacearchaeota archaeon]